MLKKELAVALAEAECASNAVLELQCRVSVQEVESAVLTAELRTTREVLALAEGNGRASIESREVRDYYQCIVHGLRHVVSLCVVIR